MSDMKGPKLFKQCLLSVQNVTVKKKKKWKHRFCLFHLQALWLWRIKILRTSTCFSLKWDNNAYPDKLIGCWGNEIGRVHVWKHSVYPIFIYARHATHYLVHSDKWILSFITQMWRLKKQSAGKTVPKLSQFVYPVPQVMACPFSEINWSVFLLSAMIILFGNQWEYPRFKT